MLAPLLLAAIVLYFLREPINYWRQGELLYDEQAIQEWVREARVGSSSLPEMLKDFQDNAAASSTELETATPGLAASIRFEHGQKREEIRQFIAASRSCRAARIRDLIRSSSARSSSTPLFVARAMPPLIASSASSTWPVLHRPSANAPMKCGIRIL